MPGMPHPDQLNASIDRWLRITESCLADPGIQQGLGEQAGRLEQLAQGAGRILVAPNGNDFQMTESANGLYIMALPELPQGAKIHVPTGRGKDVITLPVGQISQDGLIAHLSDTDEGVASPDFICFPVQDTLATNTDRAATGIHELVHGDQLRRGTLRPLAGETQAEARARIEAETQAAQFLVYDVANKGELSEVVDLSARSKDLGIQVNSTRSQLIARLQASPTMRFAITAMILSRRTGYSPDGVTPVSPELAEDFRRYGLDHDSGSSFR